MHLKKFLNKTIYLKNLKKKQLNLIKKKVICGQKKLTTLVCAIFYILNKLKLILNSLLIIKKIKTPDINDVVN